MTTGLIALGVAAVAWFALAPTLDNGFIDIDDGDNFTENHAYRGLGLAQVVYAFGGPRASIYQPLNSLLWSVVYHFWGLDPRGYHLASLGFHAFNAVILLALARAVVSRWQTNQGRDYSTTLTAGAGLAVAWFAAHPSRVEPVAWATTLLYLSCTFFAQLSVLAYLRRIPVMAPRSGRDGGPWRSLWQSRPCSACRARLASLCSS